MSIKHQHRFSHGDVEISRCNICGKPCKLSKDHVFPKGLLSFEDGDIENLHIFQSQETSLSPKNKGVFFRTICDVCNNCLGGNYDKDLIDFVVSARSQLERMKNLISMSFRFPECYVSLETIPSNVCRGVIGHLLSARISHNGPMMSKMRRYVLYPDHVLPDEYHLYSWLYPKEEFIVSTECMISNSITDYYFYDCYKAYPIGFLLSNRAWDIMGSTDLLSFRNQSSAVLDFDCFCHPHPDWPESSMELSPNACKIFGANMYNAWKYVRKAR